MKASTTTSVIIMVLSLSSPAFAQTEGYEMDMSHWFGILELPFLFLCIYFAFMTARALRGGVFGKGMQLMAWGFLIMAAGHINMQLIHFFQFNLFTDTMGDTLGTLVWFFALILTWSLSGLGFYKIYKAASKG